MLARTHVLVGTLSWIAVAPLFKVVATPIDLGVALVAALLPDIDHHKSFVGRVFFFISFWMKIFVGHRNLTHSFAFALLLFSVAYLTVDYFSWNYIYAYAFLVGYLSHIFADYIVSGGVQLFFPYQKKYSLNLFVTGDLVEYILIGVLTLTLAVYIALNYETVLLMGN